MEYRRYGWQHATTRLHPEALIRETVEIKRSERRQIMGKLGCLGITAIAFVAYLIYSGAVPIGK